MAELLSAGVLVAVAKAGEFFFKRPDETNDSYGSHLEDIESHLHEQQLLEINRKTVEDNEAKRVAAMNRLGTIRMEKVRNAAKHHGIDLNTIGVVAQDKVSFDQPQELQTRRVEGMHTSTPNFFNKTELEGECVSQDAAKQTFFPSYEQASARNEREALINQKYRNDAGGLLHGDQLAENQFDGEKSHYATSGKLRRPEPTGRVLKRGQAEGANPACVQQDYEGRIAHCKGPSEGRFNQNLRQVEPQQYTDHTMTQVSEVRGPGTQRVNPRQNRAAMISAPDTVSSTQARFSGNEWRNDESTNVQKRVEKLSAGTTQHISTQKIDPFTNGYTEEQLHQMVQAPASTTQTMNRQNQYDAMKYTDEEAAKLVNSGGHMSSIVEANKASNIEMEDTEFRFYTDTNTTQKADDVADTSRVLNLEEHIPQHTVQDVTANRSSIVSTELRTEKPAPVEIDEGERSRVLGNVDIPLGVEKGAHASKLGSALIGDARTVLGDDTTYTTTQSGLVRMGGRNRE